MCESQSEIWSAAVPPIAFKQPSVQHIPQTFHYRYDGMKGNMDRCIGMNGWLMPQFNVLGQVTINGYVNIYCNDKMLTLVLSMHLPLMMKSASAARGDDFGKFLICSLIFIKTTNDDLRLESISTSGKHKFSMALTNSSEWIFSLSFRRICYGQIVTPLMSDRNHMSLWDKYVSGNCKSI